MLNPMPASARASETAAGRACHQVWAANTRHTYEIAPQARITAVFRYMAQQSRSDFPVARKYAATRRSRSAWNPSVSRGNFGGVRPVRDGAADAETSSAAGPAGCVRFSVISFA